MSNIDGLFGGLVDDEVICILHVTTRFIKRIDLFI